MGQCASELATERPKRRVAAPTIGNRRSRRRMAQQQALAQQQAAQQRAAQQQQQQQQQEEQMSDGQLEAEDEEAEQRRAEAEGEGQGNRMAVSGSGDVEGDGEVHPHAVADDGVAHAVRPTQVAAPVDDEGGSADVAGAIAEVFGNPLSGPAGTRNHHHTADNDDDDDNDNDNDDADVAAGSTDAVEPERAQPSVAPAGSPVGRPLSSASPPPLSDADQEDTPVHHAGGPSSAASPCAIPPTVSASSSTSSLAAEPTDASMAASDLDSAFDGTFSEPPSDCPNDDDDGAPGDGDANASDIPNLKEDASGVNGSCNGGGAGDGQHATESFADVSRSPGTFSPPPPHPQACPNGATPNEPLTTSSNSRPESGLGAADDDDDDADDHGAPLEASADVFAAALKSHDNAWAADAQARKFDGVRGWLVAVSDGSRRAASLTA